MNKPILYLVVVLNLPAFSQNKLTEPNAYDSIKDLEGIIVPSSPRINELNKSKKLLKKCLLREEFNKFQPFILNQPDTDSLIKIINLQRTLINHYKSIIKQKDNRIKDLENGK